MQNTIIRFVAYALVLAGAVGIIHYDAARVNFSESSFTETAQELLLLSIVVVGLLCVRKAQQHTAFLYFLIAIAAMSLVREFNNYLIDNFFRGAWQLGVALIAIPATIYLVKRFQALKNDIIALSDTAPFGILLIGGLILHVFSRLYGKKTLWQNLMQEHYVRVVKEASEEGIELLGYSIIFIACMELFLKALKKPAPSETV